MWRSVRKKVKKKEIDEAKEIKELMEMEWAERLGGGAGDYSRPMLP